MMGISRLALVLLLWLCYGRITTGQYICYRDDICSQSDSRPVFTLAESQEQCCRMPLVQSAMLHDSSSCSSCGQPRVERVGLETLTLMPPSTLVLEVEAAVYSAITWLYNGTAMLDVPRLALEEYSQRLLLHNTTAADAGLYEADVHPIGDGPVQVVRFIVLPPLGPTVTPTTVITPTAVTSQALPQLLRVETIPESAEVNVYQPHKEVTLMCLGTYAQMLTWTSSLDTRLVLNEYCMVGLVGEAPLDPTSQSTTPFPDYGSAEGSGILPTPTDYSSDNTAPPPTDLFMGEAPLLPSPTPVPHPDSGGEEPFPLPPELCSVQTVIVDGGNGTIHSVLTLNALTLEESVTFTCTAEGGAGSVNSTAELVITDVPYFVARPHLLVSHVIFEEVVFGCSAVAESAPTIAWFKREGGQDTLLRENNRTFITTVTSGGSTQSNLTLVGAESTDAGLYVCVASSNDSISEAQSRLEIRVPATITRGPDNVEFSVMGTAAITCQSVGIPAPDIFWSHVLNDTEEYLDDLTANISSVTSQVEQLFVTTSTLMIPSLQFTDEGVYRCTTFNGLLPLDSITVARADGNLTIAPVPCLSDEQLCFSGDECVPVTLACDHTPDCGDGSDEECSQFPATIIQGPENVTVTVYDSAEFTCESFGYPEVTISWTFRGDSRTRPIVSSERVHIAESVDPEASTRLSRLTILGVGLEDSGEYLCVVNNQVRATSPRTQQMVSALLRVLPVPTSIIIVTGDDGLVEGQTLHLECRARATPTPVVTWLRNGRPITLEGEESARYSVAISRMEMGYTVSTLRVKGAVPGAANDEGEYSCRIDNVINSTTNVPAIARRLVHIQYVDDCVTSVPHTTPCLNNARCKDRVGGYVCLCVGPFEGQNCSQAVNVEEIPAIVVPPQNMENVQILEPVVFSCAASGSPQPVYSWHKDDEFVGNTSVGGLTLQEVRPEDRGSYTCTAHNQHGSSTESAAGLLSIRGVFQYLVTFKGCNTGSLEETLAVMAVALSGTTLPGVDTTIYSFTPRPLPNAPSPSNQVIVTVVTGSMYQEDGTTKAIRDALRTALQVLSGSHSCVFTAVIRYDGCAETTYSLNEGVFVVWRESDIRANVEEVCPCGTLDTSVHGHRLLTRTCGGTFTYGGEWEEVENGCGFTNITYGLCDITKLSSSDQFSVLARATEAVLTFSAIDISIASLIVSNLAKSEEVLQNQTHQEMFAQTYNNLLKASKDKVVESQQRFNSSSMLLESLDTFSLRIQPSNASLNLTTDLIQIQIEDTPLEQFAGSSFSPQILINDTEGALLTGASLTLPPTLVDLFPSEDGKTLRVAHSVLLRDTLFVFQELQGNQKLGNVFISATLSKRVEGLQEPVTIEFHQKKGLLERNQTANVTCVFWEFPTNGDQYGRWSSEGCRLASMENGVIRCKCDHLTHFGVLLTVEPLVVQDLPLEIITRIGIAVSLVCIAVTLLTYICSRNLRKKVIGKMIINSCIPLGLFYVWFLLAVHGQHYGSVEWFCYICSSLVQYFLLVYLSWTTVEAVHIYLKLVRVFGSNKHHFMLKSAVFAWGVPALITALCTGLGIPYNLWALRDHGGSLYICYPTSWPLYFGVILPFGVVFLFNLVMFVVIMASLTRRFYQTNKMKGDLAQTNNLKELRQLILIAICLSVLFSLGWVFGLVPQIQDQHITTVSQYIFSLFVGFQGAFIFFFHGLRSAEVRKQWKKWFYKLLCCVKTPKDLLTTSAHSHHPNPNPSAKTEKGALTKITAVSEHRQNPLYQSTDHLDSYGPVNTDTKAEDTLALLPTSPIRLSKEVAGSGEAQTLQVEFPSADQESSGEEEDMDFGDLSKVPFSEGSLGTAIGADQTISTEL